MTWRARRVACDPQIGTCQPRQAPAIRCTHPQEFIKISRFHHPTKTVLDRDIHLAVPVARSCAPYFLANNRASGILKISDQTRRDGPTARVLIARPVSMATLETDGTRNLLQR